MGDSQLQFTHSATTMALLRAALLASLAAACCSAAPVTKAMKNFGHSIKQAPLAPSPPARPLCS